MSKFYLSGPITGIPGGNKTLFDSVSKELRRQGLEILSPLDFDSAQELADTLKSHYGDVYWSVLARDVKLISTLDGMIFLPGWERSRGALLEATAGLLLKTPFQFFEWDGTGIQPMHKITVALEIHTAISKIQEAT